MKKCAVKPTQALIKMLKAAKSKVVPVRFSVLQLCKFSGVCVTLAVKKKGQSLEQFLLVQQCYRAAKIPHVTFQVVSKLLPACEWGWHLSRTCSWCVFYADPGAVSSLLIFKPICSDKQRRLIKVYMHTYILSDPRRSGLSVWSWILPLTQTAALLQSSVVHFCCRT